MPGSNLFHSLMTLGMKEFLKYSDLQETILKELTSRRELLIDVSWSYIYRSSLRGVLSKRYSENIVLYYRRISMLMCNFNKVALQSNFIEIALRYGCSPVNLLNIFRTPFSRNTSGWLFLNIGWTTSWKNFIE